MSIKKTGKLALLLALCLLLSGCRTRLTAGALPETGGPETESAGQALSPDPLTDDSADQPEKSEEPGGWTKENPEASRKEYDENAPAEIIAGSERTVHGEGDGDGAFAANEEAEASAARLNERAEETAKQTVAAEEAEQMGVSEDAKEADSAMTYFTVLLRDRTDSLFECQRLNAYWETAEDHVTVFKTSPEHFMLLSAGAYDVSARLLAENLRVDDGWIGRKNPGLIVKIVNSGVLGTGISSLNAARKAHSELLARDGWQAMDAVRNGRVLLLSEELLAAPHLQTAAMLMIAKTAYPAQFSDVDAEKALNMLAEEAAGSVPSGIFYYNGQGGS